MTFLLNIPVIKIREKIMYYIRFREKRLNIDHIFVKYDHLQKRFIYI